MTDDPRDHRSRSDAALRRVHGRRSRQLRRRARRDLRLSRRERRRQVDHDSHAVRPAEADVRHRDGRRRRRQPRSGGRQAAHRLHVAEVLALRSADRRSEHHASSARSMVSTTIRSRAAASSSSRWPAWPDGKRPGRANWPAAGASGWRSAAPSSTSRGSSSSTSRPAASIRSRRRQFWRLIEDLSAIGRHDSRHHALPRRSRALPPHRDHQRRQAGGDRHVP